MFNPLNNTKALVCAIERDDSRLLVRVPNWMQNSVYVFASTFSKDKTDETRYGMGSVVLKGESINTLISWLVACRDYIDARAATEAVRK